MDMLAASAGIDECIIVIFCLAKTAHGTSVKYAQEGRRDVYVFSRVPSFLPYLETLLQRMATRSLVKVILVHQDMAVLADVLRLVVHKSERKGVLCRRAEYAAKYKEMVRSLGGGTPGQGADSGVALPDGHADYPPAFEVAVVQNGDGIDGADYLAAKHVATQQMLRLVALKHGVRFAALSGLLLLAENTAVVAAAAHWLFRAALGTDRVVYTPESSVLVGPVLVHQYIPVGWDSWAKILLVARSAPRLADTARLFGTEAEIRRFNEAYDGCFEDVHAMGFLESEDGYVLQAAQARLMPYLDEGPGPRLPEKPALPMTYGQFLQRLHARQQA